MRLSSSRKAERGSPTTCRDITARLSKGRAIQALFGAQFEVDGRVNQAMSDRMIHLVGSIPFRTPAEVFERVGRILGPRLYSIPDGETGERLGWIACLEPIFAAHPQFESTGQKYTARASGSDTTGKYRLKAGVSPEDVRFDNLPFARIAVESFREFERVKRTGALPPSVRFQLTLLQ